MRLRRDTPAKPLLSLFVFVLLVETDPTVWIMDDSPGVMFGLVMILAIASLLLGSPVAAA